MKTTAQANKDDVISNYHFTDNDILCSRGNGVLAHPGNISYMKLIKENKDNYQQLKSAREKRKLVKNLLTQIQTQNPPGRFFKCYRSSPLSQKINDGGELDWYEVIDAVQIEKKISQALREKPKPYIHRSKKKKEKTSDTKRKNGEKNNSNKNYNSAPATITNDDDSSSSVSSENLNFSKKISKNSRKEVTSHKHLSSSSTGLKGIQRRRRSFYEYHDDYPGAPEDHTKGTLVTASYASSRRSPSYYGNSSHKLKNIRPQSSLKSRPGEEYDEFEGTVAASTITNSTSILEKEEDALTSDKYGGRTGGHTIVADASSMMDGSCAFSSGASGGSTRISNQYHKQGGRFAPPQQGEKDEEEQADDHASSSQAVLLDLRHLKNDDDYYGQNFTDNMETLLAAANKEQTNKKEEEMLRKNLEQRMLEQRMLEHRINAIIQGDDDDVECAAAPSPAFLENLSCVESSSVPRGIDFETFSFSKADFFTDEAIDRCTSYYHDL